MAGRSALFTLRNQEIFTVFKEGLQENITKTQNLLDCKDDILYLWHASENCLLTLNIQTLDIDEKLNYQRLVGTEPTSFAVSTVLVNPISTWAVVSGPRGATVMRLPRRSGPWALFQGGRDTVICKSKTLDERVYMGECEIYRTRWHPNSSTDSHLLILGDDNTLRLYDAADDEQPLKQIWRIGRKGGRLPLLASLGDIAVDIFIGHDNQAFLLTGNGNLHLMTIKEDQVTAMEGPLTMYPPADDNYGLESCSVLKLGANLVCIATCVGTIYHCILLPDATPDDNTSTSYSYSYSRTMHKPIPPKVETTHSLYVIEAIELDLGLSLDDDDPSYTCPVYLTADEGVKNRYFCFHETGVHIITVPLINQLDSFFKLETIDNISDSLPQLNQPSIVEYAICTKTSKINVVNPLIGLCVTYSTHALISLLADCQIVIKLLDFDWPGDVLFDDSLDTSKENNMNLNKSNLTTSLKEMQKVPFYEQIRGILKHELSQPILKVANTAEPNSQDCFELLIHTTHIYREDYFSRLERAHKEIEKRVKTLNLLKKLQLQELEEWENSNELVVAETQHLKEKCDAAKNAQIHLNKRCVKILQCLRKKHSTPSIAEKQMSVELNEFNNKIPRFIKDLENIKQKQNVQKSMMQNWDDSKKKEEVFLGKHLSEIIKNTLEQQTKQIKDLISKINTMKVDLEIE